MKKIIILNISILLFIIIYFSLSANTGIDMIDEMSMNITPENIFSHLNTLGHECNDTSKHYIENKSNDSLYIRMKNQLIGGYANDVIVKNNIAYVSIGYQFAIFDVSDKANPQLLSSIDLWGQGIFIIGDYAYIAGEGLHIVDISDIYNPTIVSGVDIPYTTWEIYVQGNYAFVAGHAGLYIYDINDPLNLVKVSDCGSWFWDVWVRDNYAYVAAADNNLIVYDITDIENPDFCGWWNPENGYSYSVFIENNYAYLTQYGEGFRIIDISDPTSPYEVGYYKKDDFDVNTNCFISGNYAFVCNSIMDGDSASIRILDISDKSNPILISEYYSDESARGVFVDNNYAFVANGGTGLRLIDIYNIDNIIETGSYYVPSHIFNIKIAENNEYLIGDSYYRGIYSVDLDNLKNNIKIGHYDTYEPVKDIVLTNNYVYSANDDSGLVNINIEDYLNPYRISSLPLDEPANHLAISNSYAYVVSGDTCINIIDITNENNFTIEGQCYTNRKIYDIVASNNYVYLGDERGITIVDVTNKANPIIISEEEEEKTNYIYIDSSYAILSQEDIRESILFIDVSNPSDPVRLTEWYADFDTKIGEIVKEGNYLYFNDTEMNRLIVLDILSLDDIKVAGYYDFGIKPYDLELKDSLIYISFSDGGIKTLEYFGNLNLSMTLDSIYYVRDIDTLQWSADLSFDRVVLEYSYDNGSTWALIDTVENNGHYEWTIPNTPATECLIKISAREDSNINAISNDPFAISRGTIDINYPDGENSLIVNSKYIIDWQGTGNTNNVILSYSINAGDDWSLIDTVANTGEYIWTVPNQLSVDCFIKIQSLEFPSVQDTSNSNFSINIDGKARAYPNPADKGDGHTSITFGGLSAGMDILIYDIRGTLIEQTTVSDISYTWDISNKSPGMYIYVIKDENGNMIKGTIGIKK